MKNYLNKDDIIHYIEYGPMDFNFKQMMFYWFIIDLPILTIFTLLLVVLL